jgi:chemotaxis protein methyltransferase CheR
MIELPAAAQVERFRGAVAARLGLHLDGAGVERLSDVLARRLAQSGLEASVYLDRLDAGGVPRTELRDLARELTVPETYFFRNPEQFRAFREVALKERMHARGASRTLNVLSAGCASGEEPYSLAILFRESPELEGWNVTIRAVDVNAAVIERAQGGRFSAWSLRETPADVKLRWFRASARDFVLADAVRDMVTFEERNLADEEPALWRREFYDVVFCRNVVMYFTPQVAAQVVSRIRQSLVPGGFLFLGYAETLRGLSADFHLHHSHDTFYYRRKAEVESRLGAPQALAPSPATLGAPRAPEDSWVDVIQRASARIRTLVERPASTAGGAALSAEPAPAAGVERAVDLLQQERFAEALTVVRALPPRSAADPDVLLLRAVLLTQGGRLAEAEEVCTRLLAVDELSAGAHYVMALCQEAAGNGRSAEEHDRMAIHLDPGFSMARLHLGLLARRAGDRRVARHELGRALVLLQSEDPSRLLLFGGGFNREALTALCQAQLVAMGGAG